MDCNWARTGRVTVAGSDDGRRMKIYLVLQFRGLARDLLPLLPPKFMFLSDNLEDYETTNEIYRSDNSTSTAVLVEAALADEIIAWGRQKREGRSLLRSARLNDIYEALDLEGQEVVEVFAPYGQNDRSIRNAKEALEVTWMCRCCDRVTAAQIGELSVTVNKKLDLQLTDNSEWIVSDRVQRAMRDLGVSFRPLKNTQAFAQALVSGTCFLRPDVAPCEVLDDICPGCGRRSLGRSDWVEGEQANSDYPDIYLTKDIPVTVSHCEPESITLARSNECIQIAMRNDGPIHDVGAMIDYRQIAPVYYFARPVLFAGAELVLRLLEMGATGFRFRPVKRLLK